MIPIQATISGFFGKPASLYSAYDSDSKILVISVESTYNRERQKNCIVITNDQNIERDMLFNDQIMKDGIPAYFELSNSLAMDGVSNRLVFNERAMRANPNAAIERDGLDSNGYKYRISETISNTQVAALATCWYALHRPDNVNKVFNMIDKLNVVNKLNSGEIYTI